MPDVYMTAEQAAAELGIQRQTLYAYVSRGLVRSEAAEGGRERRYHREDIARLRQRREQRRNPDRAMKRALDFGGPLLESAITQIEDGHFYYRGYDVLELAEHGTFEQVASEIWGVGGVREQSSPQAVPTIAGEDPIVLPPELDRVRLQLEDLPSVDKLAVLLPLLAHHDLAAHDLRSAALVRTGWRVVRAMTLVVTGGEWQGDVVQTLATGWGCRGEVEQSLIRRALILSMDHELNVSAFTARCVASSGTHLYGVVSGGLAALQGVRHGGHTRRVEAFLRECSTPSEIYRTMAERLQRGESIPGLGQRLYPQGDPRARHLLAKVQEVFPESPAVAMGEAYCAAGWDLLQEHPTVDLGLVVVARALGLPKGAALTLFALGRAVGWIGHAIEEYASGRLIRPRARYSGEGKRELPFDGFGGFDF